MKKNEMNKKEKRVYRQQRAILKELGITMPQLLELIQQGKAIYHINGKYVIRDDTPENDALMAAQIRDKK